jgi:GT2 family glycosyltransferase
MDYDLVIVSHNAKDCLVKCIESLKLVAPKKVIVVDNASTDETLPWLVNCNPNIHIVLNKENLGYSQACNIGVRECISPVIGLLNMDTEFVEDITPMIEYLERNNDIGCIGPKQVDSANKIRYAGTFLEKCGMKTLHGSYHRGWEEEDTPNKYTDIRDVHYVSGSALFIKREVYHRFGGFDDMLPLYFEDVLLCFRLQKAGLRTVYFGRVRMKHEWMKSNNSRERHNRLWKSMGMFREMCEKEGIEHRLDFFKNNP